MAESDRIIAQNWSDLQMQNSKNRLLLALGDTAFPWLIACDANMEPDAIVQGKWFEERSMIIQVRLQMKWKSMECATM